MEDWLLHDSGDDSDKSEEPDPSIETIVAAFREALRRQRRKEKAADADLPDSGRLEGGSEEETTWEEEERKGEAEWEEEFPAEPESEPELESPSASHREMIEETIVAFRKARHRAHEAEQEADVSEEKTSRSDRSERASDPTRPSEQEGAPPEEEETDVRLGESMEDFALAFREALEEKGRSEPGAAGDGAGAKDRSEGAGQEERPSLGPPEPEADPTEQVGDGVPSSSEVEVSEGGPSASTSGPSGRPARPDSSFLWVTDRPESDSATVSVENLAEPRAQDAEAFLLEGGGRKPYELLRRIRGYSDMNIYLKPVFWVHTGGQESPVAQHVDGEWAQGGGAPRTAFQEQAALINRRIRSILGGGERGESGMELRVLRFMATRNHEFVPNRTAQNPSGFVYPKLTPLYGRESRRGGGELVQILSVLEERRLVTGEFFMRQHACRNCASAFLNFEEVCPHCGSTNLNTEDLVHHFRCAFTGPLSEFKREKGRLVCPKCDRYLKQIGVDYDKPSVVHTCRQCHEQFQEPEVQTTCYRCEHTYSPEEQIKRQVKEYEITALGEETAVYGLSDSLLSILERESRVLDYATFELVVESEAARIERYQRSASSLLLVRVAGLQQLRMELGQRSQEVVEEIATAFDNTLRSSDYLSARDESLYLFLLTETDESGARRAGERLEENIEGVLGQNLEHPPSLDIGVQPLRPGLDLDEVAERFLSSRSRERATAGAR